jgi:hypothetical protein
MGKQGIAKKAVDQKAFPVGNLTPHKLSRLVPGEMNDEELYQHQGRWHAEPGGLV